MDISEDINDVTVMGDTVEDTVGADIDDVINDSCIVDEVNNI